jgi:hypothetical protein
MKLITGAGLAAGALMFAGGTSVAALSQSATADSPLGTTSSVSSTTTSDGTSDDLSDFDATEIDQLKAEDAAADVDRSGVGAALVQAHAAAMQSWAQCVRDAASGPKTTASQIPPKLACGEKPAAPGQLEQQSSAQSTEGDDTESDAPESDAPDTESEHSDTPDTHAGDDAGDQTATSDAGEDSGSHHDGGSDD